MPSVNSFSGLEIAMHTYTVRLCFVLVIAFLLSAVAFGQSSSEARNGYWWNSSTDTFKVGYVTGYAEGAEASSINWQVQNMISVKHMSKLNSNLATKMEDFDQIRFGQYESGLDAFYKDYRNMSIHVSDAMPYVRDQIKGVDERTLERELNSLRKMSVSPGYDQ